MKLAQWFDYFGQISAQFPIASLRVAYTKAGSQPAACILRDQNSIVENLLYWMAPAGEAEAHYLIAILNSETARARAEQYQSRGQWDARHFDKVIFNLPIPRFNEARQLHLDLAAAAARAEEAAALVELPEGVKFQRARGLIRAALTETDIAQSIDGLVARLLDGA